MAERGLGRRFQVYTNKTYGTQFQVYIDAKTGIFRAEAYNETLRAKTYEEICAKLDEMCERFSNLEWVRVLDVEVEHHYVAYYSLKEPSQYSDEIRPAGISVQSSRYWLAQKGDGSWLKYSRDEDSIQDDLVPDAATMMSEARQFGEGSDFKIPSKTRVSGWTSGNEGIRMVLPYDDALWKSLQELHVGLIHMTNVIEGTFSDKPVDLELRDNCATVLYAVGEMLFNTGEYVAKFMAELVTFGPDHKEG